MNDLLRATLKDWTPPAIRRFIHRRLNERPYVQEYVREPWGRARYGLRGLRLPGGRRFSYRADPGDRTAVKKVFFESQYSTQLFWNDGEIQRFYRECEHPLIIDAGAHVGAASVWFALSYPRATVIAVEPHEDNFTFLQANVRAFPNILPVRAALSSTAGTLFLTDPTGGAASDAYRARATATGVASRVDAVTLPDLLERAPDTTPFICKLDIEGAEQDLFSKPSPLMAGFPLVIAELHDWMFPGQATSRNLLQWHVDQDRDLVTLGENVFSIARSISEPVAERVEVASAG